MSNHHHERHQGLSIYWFNIPLTTNLVCHPSSLRSKTENHNHSQGPVVAFKSSHVAREEGFQLGLATA